MRHQILFARALTIAIVGFALASLATSCGDPRTGGIRAEIRDFEQDIEVRAWEACGAVEPSDENNVLNEAIPVRNCWNRLGWSLNSCERDALANHPEAAREHFKGRLQAQWSVIRCCQAGGPGMPEIRRSEQPACDATTVDACIARANANTKIGERVVTPGLELYYADDNKITSEVTACLDLDGYTHRSAMLPRVCGKTYVCPPVRVVTQCYSDGTCDDQFEEVVRTSPWYDGSTPTARARDGGVQTPDTSVVRR